MIPKDLVESAGKQNLLFGRKAQLVVGPRAGFGKLIKDLRIKFEIEKTSEDNPNRAKISIYNLAPDTRALFEQKNIVATLSAGYGIDLKTIFAGDITRVNGSVKEGPDRLTVLETGDSQTKLKESKLTKSFAPGTNFYQIINEIAATLKLPIRQQGMLPEVFSKGVSVSGTAQELLSKFLKKQELEWSIQDGVIIIKKATLPDLLPVVRLSSNSGLIGSPEKRENGLDFKCLLMPSLIPGSPVIIDSDVIKGTFICRKVSHEGDTKEGQWMTKVEAL